MAAVFIKLLNMSISASWLILAVILLRVFLKKAPKWIRCILWGIVAIRLIFPFSIESIFSLLPSAETIPQDIMYVDNPTIHTGVMAVNGVANPYLSESMAPQIGNSINPMQMVMNIGTVIWIAGMVGMLIYAVISYMRIKKKADVTLPVKENIYFCDYIDMPFVLGILRPRIYLPSVLLEDDKAGFVIAHEKAHIRRGDHWWKPLGFLLLTIYWFNPVIWIAYILLCRDIELACDEYVIGSLEEKEKKTYSDALLSCSMISSGYYRNMISACPLAFGEVGVKDRVKAVLHYKKPAFWLVILGVLSCIIIAICFLTNPKDKDDTLQAPEPFRCNAISEDSDAYVEAVYYPNGFDWDYEQLPQGYINEKGTLIFSTDWDTDSLVISEDYYNNFHSESRNTFIERETYTVKRNKNGKFELDVELRSANGDMAVYFVQAPEGVYVLKIIFADDTASLDIAVKQETSDLKQYKPDEIIGMPYKDFQKLTEITAELYHANFYAAEISAWDLTAIFLAEGWDAENAMTFLEEDDCVIRLEGTLDKILPNITETMSLVEFTKDDIWGGRLVDYCIEEGAGTAYYVADRYVAVRYDTDGNNQADRELQIALDESDIISPNSYCWLGYQTVDTENMDTPVVDSEYVLNQAIQEAILNQYKTEKSDGLYHCAEFALLEQEEICGVALMNSGRDNIELITVYGVALHESFGFSGATFHEVEYDYVPVKLQFQKESENEYVLKDSWFPEKPIESWDSYQEAIWDTFSSYSEELADDLIYAIQDSIYLTSLRQKCYEQAVSFGAVDTDTVIEGLLEDVVASPGTFASGVKDYIEANKAAYKELIYYGKYTLWYCFGEFLEGGQTDLRGQIMASVCKDIMLGFGEAMLTDTQAAHGQEWFGMFYEIARSLERQYTEEELKNDYPASWLVIKMAEMKGYGEREEVPLEEVDWEKILKDHLRNE